MKKVLFFSLFLLSLTTMAQISNHNLIGYYPFNGNANDSTANAFHGTVYGAQLTTDRFGNPNSAYLFDGVSNYIQLSSDFDVLPRSVSFWFNTFTIGSTLGFVYCSDNPALVNGLTNFGVQYYNFEDSWWSTVSIVNRFGSISPNSWHHGVIVVDSNFTNKYIDGNLIYSDSLTSFYSSAAGTNEAIIGANRYTTGEFFNGMIDDVRIYNRVLEPCEITALYNENICFVHITVTDTLIINANLTGLSPVTYKNSIKIYPNPTNDHITIDNGANFSTIAGNTIMIMNSLSQVVFQSAINTQYFIVDLSTWTGNGVYFVHIIDAGGHTTDIRKIVIQ